jgi:hypothetical protein
MLSDIRFENWRKRMRGAPPFLLGHFIGHLANDFQFEPIVIKTLNKRCLIGAFSC